MLPRLNTEFLITLAGTAISVAGVILIAWILRRHTPKPAQRFHRARFVLAGFLMILIGMHVAMKKYIDAAGWGQWTESMVMWLVPILCSMLLACAAATLLWAMFADRARGRRRCPRCWYDMSGSVGLVCPECGKDAKTPGRLHRTRPQGRLALLAMILALLGSVQFAVPWINRGSYLPLIPTRILIGFIPRIDSVHPRAVVELDRRLALPRPPEDIFRTRLRTLAPISETARVSLSQVAVPTLAGNPRHPARRLLFELLPDYLRAVDAPRAQPFVLAALNDPDPIIRLGALTSLRRVEGFHAPTCIPAVAAMMTPSIAARGVFNNESVLSDAVAYLGERGGTDPAVVPALLALLRPAGSRFGEWISLHDEVLWALARLGPHAKDAVTRIVAVANQSPTTDRDALTLYAVLSIQGRHPTRPDVLRAMQQRPEEVYRAFAALEFSCEPDKSIAAIELRFALLDHSMMVRLCAATALLSLDQNEKEAGAVLDRELGDALGLMMLEPVVMTLGRHKIDLTPLQSRLEKALDYAKGTHRQRVQHALDAINYCKVAARPIR